MVLPLKTVKSGALRMFMGFWLMGQSGWSSVGEKTDGSITALFADGGTPPTPHPCVCACVCVCVRERER